MILDIAATFLITFGMCVILANTSGRWQILDIPNERSLHLLPTPRTGGVAILVGLFTGSTIAWFQGNLHLGSSHLFLALSITILGIVALLDDKHTLGAIPRLLIQVCVVTLLLYFNMTHIQPIIQLITAGFFLIWMINLYNFMDGMDGFAGGMAVTGFGTFALLAWQAGYPDLALGCAVVVAAAGGFLLLNFPPARLFMGDTGSTVLGLLAGVVILTAHREAILPVWLGILVFSPFIIDASITISRRLLRGEKFWQAHKSHYYQRLVESGWGHRRTVLAEYVLMIACSASAVVAASQPLARQATIIAGWAVIYAAIIYWIHRVEQRREPQT